MKHKMGSYGSGCLAQQAGGGSLHRCTRANDVIRPLATRQCPWAAAAAGRRDASTGLAVCARFLPESSEQAHEAGSVALVLETEKQSLDRLM